MAEFNIYEAKTSLSRLVQQAVDGEEIVIAKYGKPMVKLVPVLPKKKKLKPREFGKNFMGITYIAPDFDAPMSEEELAEWGY
jgi:prevent-host-death family protein